MGKFFRGRIKRTGRYRRARLSKGPSLYRTVSKMPVSNPYKTARIGLNTYSSRFFPSLPPRMNICSSSYADTKYDMQIGGLPAADGTGQTICYYFWIDAINLGFQINAAGPQGQQVFYSPNVLSLFALYKEAQLRTSVLNFSVAAEYSKVLGLNPTSNEVNFKYEPVVQMAVVPIPLGYLKNQAGNPHLANQAGTLFFGVDYYSALTQMKGAKTYVVPLSGDRPSQHSKITIDGYDHNGEPQVIRNDNQWNPANGFPALQVDFPAQEQRNVFLFAFRLRSIRYANVQQFIHPRFSYKLDQHLTFLDLTPPQPYVTAAVA